MHVLQPFDVPVAAPLRVKLAQLCDLFALTIDKGKFGQLTCARFELRLLVEKRRIVFRAFLFVWDESVTESNILFGFRKTGIVPLDPSTSTSNPGTRKICPVKYFRSPANDRTG
jgi:hypothetical protein